MAIQSPHCKPKHLKRLLAGSLAEQRARDVADHLDQCDTCRSQLETLAAEDTWWAEARQFLADDDDQRVYIDDSPSMSAMLPRRTRKSLKSSPGVSPS